MTVIEKWAKFISGDDDAYAWIYETYVQTLYQYGLCFTSDTEMIKDCIQDIFVYIYSHRRHLDKSYNVRAYLLISLKNNLCRVIARKKAYGSLETEEMPFLREMTVEEKFIENEAYENELQQVKEMLSILTSRQREIMYYRFIQELSMDEICQLMNLNYQSAQNLIQRSLKKIKETYKGAGPLFLLLNVFLYQP